MVLLQRCDTVERLALTRQFPVIQQFLPMKRGPLKHMSQRSRREMSMNGTGFHFYRKLVLPVDRVEVRHAMLIVEHADYDAEKSRQFGHGFLNGLTFRISGPRRWAKTAGAGPLHAGVSRRLTHCVPVPSRRGLQPWCAQSPRDESFQPSG